jgi:hypothetical protein
MQFMTANGPAEFRTEARMSSNCATLRSTAIG